MNRTQVLQVRLLFVSLLAFLSAFSCVLLDHPKSPHDGDSDAGIVTLRFSETAPGGSSEAARTILPPVSTVVSSYVLSGIGPDGASVSLESPDPWLKDAFSSGAWSVTVRGLNSSGYELLSGTADFSIEAGASLDVSVPLYLRAGQGRLHISFLLPPSLPDGSSIDLVLDQPDGASVFAQALQSPFGSLTWGNVSSGYYLFTARLLSSDGSSDCGVAEVVRILPDTETAFCVDFASTPGVAAIAFAGPSSDPYSPVLPCWTRRSSGRPLPLEVSSLPSSALLRWFLDGIAVSAASDPRFSVPALSGPVSAGIRRLDVAVSSDGGARAGSSFMSFESCTPLSAGTWSWDGTFGPPPGSCASLPAGHGFAALCASADGSVVAALDAPPPGSGASGSAARSAVHWFSVTADGSPFFLRADPVLSDGASRSCDSLVLSPDGRYAAVWNVDSSWIAFTSADSSSSIAFSHLEADSCGGGTVWSVKDVRFSADSSILYLLTSSGSNVPYRIVALSVSGGSPVHRWTANLDVPSLSVVTFSSLAPGRDGVFLAVSQSRDVAAVYSSGEGSSEPPSFRGFLKRAASGSSWLENPVDAVPLSDGSFLVLCSDSGAVGLLRYDSGILTAEQLTDSAAQADLAGCRRIAASPDGFHFAVSGAKARESAIPRRLALGSASSAGAFSCFSESSTHPAPGRASSCAWLGNGRVISADDSFRGISVFSAE